jgi:hypothetical protein
MVVLGRNYSLAFARMPHGLLWGGMANGDRGVARKAKPGGFGVVSLGFATDAPGLVVTKCRSRFNGGAGSLI